MERREKTVREWLEEARARRQAEDYPPPDTASSMLEDLARYGVATFDRRQAERYMGQE